MKKYVILLVIASLAYVGLSHSYIIKLRAERQQLAANVESLMAGTEQYQTEAGRHAARAQQLVLTTAELESQCADLKARLADMGVQNKYLQKAVAANMQTEVKVDTLVRDSIVYVPQLAVLDTFQVVRWADAWVQLHGTISKGRFTASITSQDSLTVAIHRVPKKFWFIRWGTKRVECDVSSSNPHTQINAVKCVEIRK